ARRPRTTPSRPLSSRCVFGPPGTGTWTSDTTKNAAVSTATCGISSSRMRQAPNTASAAAATNPPTHHDSVSTPSEMWTPSSTGPKPAGMAGGSPLQGNAAVHVDPERGPLPHRVLLAVVFALPAVAQGGQAPPARVGQRTGRHAAGVGLDHAGDLLVGGQF